MSTPLPSTAELSGLPNVAKQHLRTLATSTHAPELTWNQLKKPMQDRAMYRKMLVCRIEDLTEATRLSLYKSIELLLAGIKNGTEAVDICKAADQLSQAAARKKAPNRARLYDWVNRYRSMGIMGLVDAYKGRQREF